MKKTLFILSAALLLNSCLVTKKRYDTAVMNGKKSLDSLNRVFNKTVEGFNASTNVLKISNTDKDISVDSLNREVKKLSGDKASLNQSLLNTINDYKEEKQKLSAKTRMADSLMNILTKPRLRTLSEHLTKVRKKNSTLSWLLSTSNSAELIRARLLRRLPALMLR